MDKTKQMSLVTKMASTRSYCGPTETSKTFWISWILLSIAVGTVIGGCTFNVSTDCLTIAECTSTFQFEYYGTYRTCRVYSGYGYSTAQRHVNLALKDMSNSFQWPTNFFDLYTIQSLNASQNAWSYVPSTILSFEKINALNLSRCQIDMITLHDFVKLSDLNNLDLSYNRITSLGETTTTRFGSQTKLRILSLAHNNITELGFALVPFISLTELYLDHNKLTNIRRENFKNLKNLEIIFLSHCIIESIDFSCIYNLPKLIFLDLSYNLISSLVTVNVTSTSQRVLNTLILSHNKISEISLALEAFEGLSKLYLDNNEIKVIEITTFKNLKKLKWLFINDNFITTMDPNAFVHLKILEGIDLSNNQISTRIDKRLFGNNTFLQHIDLSNNKISFLEKDVLKNMNISYFNITHNELEGSLQKGMLNGLSDVHLINISYNKLNITENLAFVSLTDMDILDLSHNNLILIELYAFSSLRNLERLDLSYNNLMKLDNDKSDLNKLSWLSLKCNNFSDLTEKSFQDLSSLAFLDLTCNHIKLIKSDIFLTLSLLTELAIENNDLQGELVEKSLNGLHSLLVLDLSWTKITALRNRSFNEVQSLQRLNLSYSHITEIEYDTFSGPTNIIDFDISHNYLTTFLLNSTHIGTLQILKLNNNYITFLRGDTFSHLFNLKELLVTHNNLSYIEDAVFRHNANLENIDLSHNKYLKSESKFIAGLPSLKLITLNGVTQLNFKELTNTIIKEIIFSSSGIQNISLLCLPNVQSLEVLNLNTNLITILENNGLNSLSKLTTLDLSRNYIKSIEPATFKDNIHLKNLNLSINKISILTFGIFKGLDSLERLDLSNNLLTVLNIHRLFAIPTLKYLIIDDNFIRDLNASDFGNSQIKEISIGGNTLSCNMLVNFMRKASSHSFRLTAKVLTYHVENVDGITCVEFPDKRVFEEFNWNSTSMNINADFFNDLAEHINDLRSKVDIMMVNNNQNISSQYKIYYKDFLSNYSQIMSTYFASQLELQTNLSKTLIYEIKQEIKILKEINSKENGLRNDFSTDVPKVDTNFTQIMSELFDTQFDILKNISLISMNNNTGNLRELLTELKYKYAHNSPYNPNSSSIPTSKLNDEEREMLIEAIKQQLIPILNERAEDILAAVSITNHSVSTKAPTLLPSNLTGSSIFMEICLGLILLLMICYIVYQIYVSKIQAAKSRESNRQLLNNLEMRE